MKEAYPGETAVEVMRRKCRAIVARAKSLGWSGPPFDPVMLASIEGIKVEETDEEIEGEGRIFPCRGRVKIQYRRGSMRERQRFTIFHEVAHTCFPDVFERVRFHMGPISDEAHRRFENLCDVGAAELLMPLEDFSRDLTLGATLRHAQALAGRYDASIDATVKRVLDLTNLSCAAVFLTDRPSKEFSSVHGRMRVRYCWRSQTFPGFFPVGTLSPPGSAILGAQPELAESHVPVKETWWISNKPRTYYIEPLRLPLIPGNLEYPQVLAMLHARKP